MAQKHKKKVIYLTKEPDWTRLQQAKTEEQKVAAFKSVEFFVHYEIDIKAKASAMRLWIKTASGWSTSDQKKINELPDYYFVTAGKIAFITKKLGYMPKLQKAHLTNQRPIWVIASDNHETELDDDDGLPKKKKVTISIQARMVEQVVHLCGEWEATLDLIVCGEFDVKKFDPYNGMLIHDGGIIKPNHAKIIKDMYSSGYAEALEIVSWEDEDIKEAYAHFDAKTRKAYLEFHEKINTACDTYIKTGKAQRKTRKPKAISKERLVNKLKYKVNDSKLGIASINPIDLVDSQEVWVYNTKNRKIGVYYKESNRVFKQRRAHY